MNPGEASPSRWKGRAGCHERERCRSGRKPPEETPPVPLHDGRSARSVWTHSNAWEIASGTSFLGRGAITDLHGPTRQGIAGDPFFHGKPQPSGPGCILALEV